MMKTIKFKDLGRGLRELRGDKTQREMGFLMGLTDTHICEIEKGNKMPSLNVIQRYAKAMSTEIHLEFDLVSR